MSALKLATINLQVLRARPAGRIALTCSVALGAAVAIAPGGLAGLPRGLGLLGGMAQGTRAAWVAIPAVTVVLAVALATLPESPSVLEAQELSGQPRLLRRGSELIAAVAFSLRCALGTLSSAALVGLGDALRRGTGWLTPYGDPFSWWGVAGVLCGAALAGCITLALPSRRHASAFVAVATGIALVGVVMQTAGHDPVGAALAKYGPFGPYVSHLTALKPDTPWSLPMTAGQQWLTLAGWLLALVTLGVISRRSWR